jgi:hypothetical protein
MRTVFFWCHENIINQISNCYSHCQVRFQDHLNIVRQRLYIAGLEEADFQQFCRFQHSFLPRPATIIQKTQSLIFTDQERLHITSSDQFFLNFHLFWKAPKLAFPNQNGSQRHWKAS